jgi:predicted ATPase
LRIPVARLDAAAAGALIVETAGQQRLAPRVVDTILQRSDGVPLFIEEITKAVIEGSVAANGIVPMTLHDSLIARLDASPAMKLVAQVAACIGRDFEESLLRRSADLAPDILTEGLERLKTAGLVVADLDGQLRFRHALLCDVAYETLLMPRRHLLHARIAQAIEASPERAASEPEVLARHWFGAGEHARAETYWLRARHRAEHWLDQFDALAEFLESDKTQTATTDDAVPRTLH